MEMNLYSVPDADNIIGKVLSGGVTININLKHTADIVNPVLVIRNTDDMTISDFNYCDIPELKRKYFIRDIQSMNGKLWAVQLECDVLETYKDDILNSEMRYYRGLKEGDFFASGIEQTHLTTVSMHEAPVSIVGKHTLVMAVVGDA